MTHTHTHTHINIHIHIHTLGRTPLGEGSARLRELYLTTINTHKRQTSIDFSKYQISAHSLNIQQYKLYYTPQHVSSSTLLIIRRTNCITTASGTVTLCKQPYSMQVESGLQSALHLHTVRLLTEGDDTRGCGDTICPPEDERVLLETC